MKKVIVSRDNQILKQRTELFNFSNPQINPVELSELLIYNMIYYEGIGLSANQIGISLKVFSMMFEGKPIVCFNPRIVEYSTETILDYEGCLSYPGFFVKIKRPAGIACTYQDAESNVLNAYYTGLASRCFQHEMDHMLGKDFVDLASNFYLSEARRKRKTNLKKLKQTNLKLWQNHSERKEKD